MDGDIGSIERWLQFYVGDINTPALWPLIAKLNESPKTFPCMVLQFLDELERCFECNPQNWCDSLYMLYDRIPQFRCLMLSSDCLFAAWLNCKHIKLLAGFKGELLPDLYFALRKVNEPDNYGWIDGAFEIIAAIREDALHHLSADKEPPHGIHFEDFTEEARTPIEWAVIFGFSPTTFHNRIKGVKGAKLPHLRSGKEGYRIHKDHLPLGMKSKANRDEKMNAAKLPGRKNNRRKTVG